MKSLVSRLALMAGVLALQGAVPALAQSTPTNVSGTITSVTDGVTTKSCTAFQVNYASGLMTLGPSDCLKTTAAPPPGDPVFSIQLTAATLTQPATASASTQTFHVDVVADRDVPTTSTYNLQFNLCTVAHACTPVAGTWQFFRYRGLGGTGFTAADALTTVSGLAFTFQPGLDTSPTEPRKMRVGQLNMANSPLFEGAKTVKFELGGTQAAAGAVSATLNGGLAIAGLDYDINGNPIPSPSGPVGALGCEFWGNPRAPGFGTGPCGGFEINVGNCNFPSSVNPPEPITKAWLYVLEDYVQPWPRVGQSMRFTMERNHAYVFRFKTGPEGLIDFGTGTSRPLTFSTDENYSRGPLAPRFLTLSETRCDFDYTKTIANGTLNGCYQMVSGGGALQAAIFKSIAAPSGPAAVYPSCPLKPETVYYLNMRYEDAGFFSPQTGLWNIGNRGKISCGTSYCAQTAGFN